MKKQRPVFERYMDGLSIEVTRRCNMNCEFCSRGKAQTLDITTEIIDKALDEVSNTMIGELRISGGEPFLVPEKIRYLFDQIIKRNIYINAITIFTNGSIIEPELIESFSAMLEYIKRREQEYPILKEWFRKTHSSNYSDGHHNLSIIVSDVAHERTDVGSMIRYYKQIEDDEFSIVLQSESHENDTDTLKNGVKTLILEGNALENCEHILGKAVASKHIRYLDNSYNFIFRMKDLCGQAKFFESDEFISKTITVSANGNVFPGCMMSYKRVDAEPLFHIAECNNDFFERVKKYCWNNPICKEARDSISEYKAIQMCQERGITVSDIDDRYLSVLRCANYVTSKLYTTLFNVIHTMLPYLDIDEVELVATAKLVQTLFALGTLESHISAYLDRCSVFNEETVGTPELCEKILDSLGDNRYVVDKWLCYAPLLKYLGNSQEII